MEEEMSLSSKWYWLDNLKKKKSGEKIETGKNRLKENDWALRPYFGVLSQSVLFTWLIGSWGMFVTWLMKSCMFSWNPGDFWIWIWAVDVFMLKLWRRCSISTHSQCTCTAHALRYPDCCLCTSTWFVCCIKCTIWCSLRATCQKGLMPISGSLLWQVLKINIPAFSFESFWRKTESLSLTHTQLS